MYTYRQLDHRYILSLANGCDLTEALTAFCRDRHILAGTISGIGAIDSLTLRFFDPATKQYVDRTFTEQMEIANLTGNISTLDGTTPYLHLHATLGRRDYTALAGHLLTARLCGAGEFVVEDFRTAIRRTFDPALGLNCYDLNQ